MKIQGKFDNEFIIYEEAVLSILVAIRIENQIQIKKHWKLKGARTLSTRVPGFPFVHDEDQKSLKINFSQENSYIIENLLKFK